MSSDLHISVSEVIGTGPEAHRLVRVDDWTMTLWEEYGDDEPRMLDTDVARRIKLKQPRNIRQMIERIWPEGQRPRCRTMVVRQSVGPKGKGVREVTVNAYWLTEAQILKLCARAETPIADAILDDMIRVYMLVRRGLLVPAAYAQDARRLATLETQVSQQAAQLAELSSTFIGPQVAEIRICAQLARIASLYSCDAKAITSKKRHFEKRLRNLLGFNELGSRWQRLNRALLHAAEYQLAVWLDEAIAHAKRNPPGQPPLPHT